MKKKYLLILEYEGTAYHGWQVQQNGITIQEDVAAGGMSFMKDLMIMK